MSKPTAVDILLVPEFFPDLQIEALRQQALALFSEIRSVVIRIAELLIQNLSRAVIFLLEFLLGLDHCEHSAVHVLHELNFAKT